MKTILTILSCLCLLLPAAAQTDEGDFRIFGEISTVEDITYKGYITWGPQKSYWIDYFEAAKKSNPYASYFDNNNQVVFSNQYATSSQPVKHLFCCRFGNIKSIRPTAENRIELVLKDGQELTLMKNTTSDIGSCLNIHTTEGTVHICWEHISEIHFMASNHSVPLPDSPSVAGVLKSKQGIYKGIVTWNCYKPKTKKKNDATNRLLSKLSKVTREKGVFKLTPRAEGLKITTGMSDLLAPVSDIMINMPNIGSVIVPSSHFQELEIMPLTELALPSYDDFSVPVKLRGHILARNGEEAQGEIAYDLDENMDIEILNGKNDNITYRIPFKYIRSIEPKNYKYSYVTLRNGSSLSLGDLTDVNSDNSGILIFTQEEIPVYIPWEELKKVGFE